MMDKNQLAKKIYSKCYLKGDFLLRSGLRSSEYFDKYCMESDPALLSATVELMAPLIPKGTEVLAGLEMGGIPLGTALSLKMNMPIRFVRKKAKAYGTMRICEGGSVKGKRLCIIEDVISTGGQVLQSAQALRAEGAIVSSVLCVIFRGESLKLIEDESLKLFYLFSKEELTGFQTKKT